MVIVYFLIFILSAVIAIIVVKTIMCIEKTYDEVVPPDLIIDAGSAAKHLSAAVKIKTIAYDDIAMTSMDAFRDFADFLAEAYPGVHRAMTREVINGASLLYRWQGRDSGIKPALFCAHIDVVPVDEETVCRWKYPPFSGEVADGHVWGRGTQDIKNQLVALFESAEVLLAKGYVPERDIYIALGHDEETRRNDGADVIAARLRERGIVFEYVLDEGGSVIDNAVPGVKRPVAFIGIAEKGFANLHVTATGEAGHSSMPPAHTAAGLVCRAVAKIESERPGLRLTAPVKLMFSAIAPATSFVTRMVLANLWLFSPFFKKIFAKTLSGNAQLRTTMAATMLKGSSAPNVLPQAATAVVNARTLHGDSSALLKERIEKAIADSTVSVVMNQVYEPSMVSSVGSYGFRRIAGVIKTLWPEAVVAPYLVVGGTDARKYEGLTDCIYRFTPMRVDSSELKQIHGTDEHISIRNIADSIRFYTAMFTG